eukprot:CAMPEP_0114434028 /NCGR_PEP_ID=MMETSP0103-20121206/12021_1 /TAXON_ID=37642 ORGANISM="Paraphysomonas imperforata, Strain PA2" /NCGR_SAMPLE_ID=MMETSP0103 /ASSEMBLY_ACC=CAM_ASM_000201 /LENGTH=285 /DNA_ID=CAMNT_0001603845 /DNA_START=243 /DNA_END=1100 /DNA_ORIENTATION=+
MNNLIPKKPSSSSSSTPSPPEPNTAKPGKKKRPNRTGKGHKKKRQAKARSAFLRQVQLKRKAQLRSRGAHSDGGKSQGPKISVQKRVMLDGAPSVSQETMDFYEEHSLWNHYLEVSEGPNASNKNGTPGEGKGVFAKCNIPAGVRVCPYVGKHKNCPCPPDEGCQYDLQLAPGIFICARDTPVDIGYLQTGYGDKDHTFIKAPEACPPNFGRYFNTAMAGAEDNCTFEIARDGHDVMFIETSRPIQQGEELLVDYGDYFYIHEDDREVDELDAATYAAFYHAYNK